MSIITRRIKIFIAEDSKDLRQDLYKKIYDWRYNLRNASNELLSYMYAKDQLQHYKFIDTNTKVEFGILGSKGELIKPNSDTYRLMTERLKGKMPSDIFNCVKQAVEETYKKTKKDILTGQKSLTVFKNNIQLRFSAKNLNNLKWSAEDKRYYFTLFGISFGLSLGADRQGNKVIIERSLQGEYKFCGSSLMIDDRTKCLYLYITVDIPIKDNKLEETKRCFAAMSLIVPIFAQVDGSEYIYNIGNKEEFLHRRIQIQQALKRAQINSQYSKGGKGRKLKLQAIDRFEKKEREYIKSRLHEYSRRLIDFAIAKKCGILHLIKVEETSEKDKANEYLLRNWTYHGLLGMIKYKCLREGIKLEL